MTRKNKFDFDPVAPEKVEPRIRTIGPMGAAVRDAARNMNESTEALVEQRRQNAQDARAYREAAEEGLLLIRVPLEDIHTDDLPRDRLDLGGVAQSDEMEELKASIRARGQKEPVELYRAADGRLQLKKGWRRVTAMRQLHAETGEAQFATVAARVSEGQGGRLGRYIDMVEENVVREDLTFAEMAQVAITAAEDADVEDSDAEAMVGRLYASLHKMKRSYVRSFVFLLGELGDDLKWPKAVARNLGVDTARALKQRPDDADDLRRRLAAAASPEAQAEVLKSFCSAGEGASAPTRTPRQKFEFHVGATKVTARNGECRILSGADYASVPKATLQEAIRAFEAVLKQGG